MRLKLQCHPDTPCQAVTALSVLPKWFPGELLRLDYRVDGDCASIKWPSEKVATRTDGLWQTTCFEMFVKRTQGTGYREYNFSPSSCWAAYQFGGYREDMELLDLASAPQIEQKQTSDRLAAEIGVILRDPPMERGNRIGLAAVIEELNGRKSYWSLAHPVGQPDFHHQDCFVHQLEAT